MNIKFKNGSEIKAIESKDNIRGIGYDRYINNLTNESKQLYTLYMRGLITFKECINIIANSIKY